MPTIIMWETTLEEIRAERPSMIFYGANTCWWTHRDRDLRMTPGSRLPCDPRGGMLLQTDEVEGFLRAAEEHPEQYGRHGILAFLAAHNDNCVVSAEDTRSTCFRTWEEYNELLD